MRLWEDTVQCKCPLVPWKSCVWYILWHWSQQACPGKWHQCHSKSKWTNGPMNEPTNEPTNASTNESTKWPTYRQINKATKQARDVHVQNPKSWVGNSFIGPLNYPPKGVFQFCRSPLQDEHSPRRPFSVAASRETVGLPSTGIQNGPTPCSLKGFLPSVCYIFFVSLNHVQNSIVFMNLFWRF